MVKQKNLPHISEFQNLIILIAFGVTWSGNRSKIKSCAVNYPINQSSTSFLWTFGLRGRFILQNLPAAFGLLEITVTHWKKFPSQSKYYLIKYYYVCSEIFCPHGPDKRWDFLKAKHGSGYETEPTISTATHFFL